MICFDGFYGNSQSKEYLSLSLAAGAFPNALMLVGPDGIGKKTLATILAGALICQSEGSKPCGECRGCRMMKNGWHPDVSFSEPQGAMIKVEQMRELKKTVPILPNDAERKVYIIKNAEKMPDKTQDALLKVLEEPPSFAYFILLTSDLSVMRETVRSRCVVLDMTPLSADEATEYFLRANSELSRVQARARALACAGIVGVGVDSSSDMPAVKIADAICAQSELSIYRALSALDKTERASAVAIIDALTEILRDAIAQNHGLTMLRDGAESNAASRALAGYGDSLISEMCECAAKSRAYLMRNANVPCVMAELSCALFATIH